MVRILPLFKTSRKVQAFGSSLALTLPVMYTRINDIEKGKSMKLFYDLDGTLILANCENEEELRKRMLKFIKTLDEAILK